MTIRIVQVGVGPLGQKIVRYAVERGLTIVGAVDKDPAKIGEDLGKGIVEVVGLLRLRRVG